MNQTPSTSGSADSGVACEQSSMRHTPSPMFQVQMIRYGEFVCDVGSPYPTRAAAEQACSDSYRADWERSGQITPTTHYLIGEVSAS